MSNDFDRLQEPRNKVLSNYDLDHISVSDKVNQWLDKLNTVIDTLQMVEPASANPVNLFGFMSSKDKDYLDSISKKLIIKSYTDDNTMISNPKDVNGDLISRELNIWAELVNTRDLVYTRSVKKVEKINASGSINISIFSSDMIIINATDDIILNFQSGNSDYGSKKIIKVNPSTTEKIIIDYNGNYRFVNDGIQPNVVMEETSPGVFEIDGTASFLNPGNVLVYEALFLDGEIVLTVIDNTEVAENYVDAKYHE